MQFQFPPNVSLIVAQSGIKYTPDIYGNVVCTNALDIISLMAAGCTFTGARATWLSLVGIDGVKITWTLNFTPNPANFFVWKNGSLLLQGDDYTIVNNILTFAQAPRAAVGADPADSVILSY